MSGTIDTGTFVSAGLHGAIGFLVLAAIAGGSIPGSTYWMFALGNVAAAFIVDYFMPRLNLKLY